MTRPADAGYPATGGAIGWKIPDAREEPCEAVGQVVRWGDLGSRSKVERNTLNFEVLFSVSTSTIRRSHGPEVHRQGPGGHRRGDRERLRRREPSARAFAPARGAARPGGRGRRRPARRGRGGQGRPG